MSAQPINRITLQRLVDGELSPSQRSELLGRIDANSPLWRDIALQLLENQIWRSELGGGLLTPGASVHAIAISDRAKETSLSGEAVAVATEQKKAKSSYWPLLQVAASIFLVLGGIAIGRVLRDQFVGLPNGRNVVMDSNEAMQTQGAPDQAATEQNANGDGGAGKVQTDRPIFVSDKEPSLYGRLQFASYSDPSQSVEMPVYEVSEIGPSDLVAEVSPEVVQLRDMLRKRGVNLNVSIEFYEGSLPDGRHVVVPVNSFVASPYGL